MGVEVNNGLTVCYEDGFIGLFLSLFLWFPFVLWISVALLHLFLRDLYSLFEFWFAYTSVWILAFAFQQGIHQPRPVRDDCPSSLGLQGRYGMPDPWLVSTSVFVLSWVAVAVLYRVRAVAFGLGMLGATLVLYAVSVLYNRYTSWAQFGVSMAFAAVLTATNVALIYYVYQPMLRQMLELELKRGQDLPGGLLNLILGDVPTKNGRRRKRGKRKT
jgi:hypothetical protein